MGLVAPFCAWALVRGLGLERGYPLVALAAFTPYVAAGSVVAALLALALRSRAPAVLGVLAAAGLLAAVVPRAVGGPDEGARGVRLRVATANVLVGAVPPRALVALVRAERVDVLSVQELTPEMADGLAAAGLDLILPHRVLAPRPGAAGTGLWARAPLRRLPPPGPTLFSPVAAEARLARGARVRLVSVHPVAPRDDAGVAQWERDFDALPAATPRGVVRVLAGDFNATLDHVRLRDLLATGYVDAAAQSGAGLAATWPRPGRRLPPGVAIDHVLADARCAVGEVSVHVLPRSDHRAVVAELILPVP